MILLHGDNTVKSRDELVLIRKKWSDGGMEVVVLDGTKAELSEIKQNLESSSLFGADRAVVVEGLLTSKKSKRQEEIIEYLAAENASNVALWEAKKLDGRKIKKFGEVKEFTVGKLMFVFLECMRPKNNRQMTELFQKVVVTDAPELVFFMMTRQVRMLLEVLSGEYKGPGWLRNKLMSQARAFGEDGLLDLHAKLFEIERKIKTGRGLLKITDEIEWMLLGL